MASNGTTLLTGTLRATRWGYYLEADIGGEWKLDLDHSRAARLVDRRLTLRGLVYGPPRFDVTEIVDG